MQKIQDWGVISLVIILSLAVLPHTGFAQIAALDNSSNSSGQSQCLDFNQDKICEFIVLANGTMIENPVKQTVQQQKQTVIEPTESKPLEGKCLGYQHNYCRNLLLANGTAVANPNFVNTFVESGPYAGSTQPGPSKEQTQTIDTDRPYGDNNNNNDNDDRDNKNNDGYELDGQHCTESDGCGNYEDGICTDCRNEQAEEREEEIAEDGGEEIDGEWFEYDEDEYWVTEDE